jgi:hypothetical protein
LVFHFDWEDHKRFDRFRHAIRVVANPKNVMNDLPLDKLDRPRTDFLAAVKKRMAELDGVLLLKRIDRLAVPASPYFNK